MKPVEVDDTDVTSSVIYVSKAMNDAGFSGNQISSVLDQLMVASW